MRKKTDRPRQPCSSIGRVRLGLAEAFALLAVSGCGTQVSETYFTQPPATMAPRGPGAPPATKSSQPAAAAPSPSPTGDCPCRVR